MSTLAEEKCQIIDAEITQKQFSKYITSYRGISVKITPYAAYKYIYLRKQEILQTLNKRDIIKFNNKFPLKIIDDVRGNDIISTSMKHGSKFYQCQIDAISSLLYKLFENIELQNNKNEKRCNLQI